MDVRLIIDILGWIGGVVLVIAFYLNSNGKLSSTGRKYQLMNLVAAIFLIINSTYHGAYPLTFVNVIWSTIALIALGKSLKKN